MSLRTQTLRDFDRYAVSTYIALFRGINVGGKNVLPMQALARIMEGAGCENVRTYIQSGNVVFDARLRHRDKLAGEISNEIANRNGFTPRILILERRELVDAIQNNPFGTDDGKALHFFFLDSRPDHSGLRALEDLKSKSEEFGLYKKTFYLYAPDGIGRSKLAARVERCLGVSATARNWNTVDKLMSMIEQTG